MQQNVLIIGLGLLGGSIALALKQTDGFRISVLGRNKKRLLQAQKSGMIDIFATTPEEIVPDADIIVFCTPVGIIPSIMENILEYIKSDCVITDIGSTKQWICSNMKRVLQKKAGLFLGAHPMAGSEKTGYENASADLFKDRTIVLANTGQENPETVTRIESFWSLLSNRIVWMPPEEHDKIVSMTSHLPHVIAFSMAYYLYEKPQSSEQFSGIYGKGLLDTLRIASSDADVWDNIIKSNRKHIADALEEYQGMLHIVENWIRTGKNEELVDLMKKARIMRDQL